MPDRTTTEAGPKRPLDAPYLPARTSAERAARNQRAKALLDEWVGEGEDATEQRETLDVLRQALGPDRVAAARRLFP